MISSMDLIKINRKLVEKASDGFWLLDRDFLTVYVNPALEEMLGYSVAEMIGRSWYDFGDPEWVERAQELEKRRESGIKEPHKFLFIHKNGGQILTRIATTPLYDDDGNFDGAIGVLSDITRQQEMEDALILKEKRAEDALREAEFNLKDVQQKSGLGSWQYDPVHQQALWSKEMFVIFGRDPQLGPPNYAEHKEMIHPDDFHIFDEAVKEAVEKGKPYLLELRLIRPDKVKRTIITICEPRLDASGSVAELKGTVQDVTERKQAEDALRDSQHRLTGIIEGTRVGTWEWNVQTGETVFNEEWAAIIGYTLDELSPVSIETWQKYAHPDDLQKSRELLEKHFSGGSDYYEFESRMRHKNGQLVWVLDRGRVASWTENRKPLWMFGTHQDITERKMMEKGLFEATALLSNITNSNPDAIYSKDLDGRYILFNNAAARFVGKSAEEVLGRNDYSLFPSDVAEILMEKDRKVLMEGTIISFEEKVTNVAGLPISMLVTKGPLRDRMGNIMGIFGISRDITDRKQAEDELLKAKATAESANRAKSEFLANMSHEIRTPMNGLLGMTQLLGMTDLSEEQLEYVAALKLSGKNLVSLVNDILDLAKIEAGKITIELAEFSLNRAIDEVYMMQKSAIFDKKLAFEVTIAEEIPRVIRGDQLRVKQIIHNLLGNAAKFTKQGSIRIAAQVQERHVDSCIIQISVTDTGIGISAEALEKIFSPFVQEDGSTTRQFGGTGLGLTISRRLAELMGGGLSVESSQGAGSSFVVKLPFTIPSLQITTDMASQFVAPTWDSPALRILLVEDNPANLKFATILLGKHGHHVVTAENGKECLEAVEQGDFDLIFLDIQMPVMNGEEALREIRAQEEGTLCHQKVIALTAHALRDEKDRFLNEGFDGYLSKPMEQQELIDEMKRVMNL